MTITRRVSGAVAANNGKRVMTTGDIASAPASIGSDTWGGTWGNSWGRSWFTGAPAIEATQATPAVNVTARVEGQVSGGHTKRVGNV